MALHNFIRIHSTRDKEFEPYDNDNDLIPEADEQVRIEEDNDQEDNSFGKIEMDEEREKIANLLMSHSQLCNLIPSYVIDLNNCYPKFYLG